MTQVNRAVLLSTVVASVLSATAARAADTPATPPTAAPAPATFEGALTGGKAHLDFRYRLETVDQDGIVDDAYASTLRTRLNYLTGEWHGFSAMLEAANVVVLGQYSLYNSTTNGATDRPVVADPKYTEINQAFLQYKYGSFTSWAPFHAPSSSIPGSVTSIA